MIHIVKKMILDSRYLPVFTTFGITRCSLCCLKPICFTHTIIAPILVYFAYLVSKSKTIVNAVTTDPQVCCFMDVYTYEEFESVEQLGMR